MGTGDRVRILWGYQLKTFSFNWDSSKQDRANKNLKDYLEMYGNLSGRLYIS